MATLTRARVGIQFPANNDLLTRVTDRKLCFKPPTAEGKDPQPREIYVDCLFREDDTPAKMAASFELDKLVSRVLNGYRAGLFVAASGRRFSATRTHVFAEALSILGRSLSEASDVSLSYAYVALTDAKCLDLTGDRVIDARGNKAALEPIYRPFSDCHDLLRVVQGGSSLPYALMIRVEKFGGARTMGSLLLCDLGLPTFDNSISEDSIRRLGPSLSLSFRTLQKIIFMKSTAGVEGPLPYHESNLTLICKDYLDGHAAMKFVLCLDASADVNQQEITGALNFAESLRKFQTLEQPTEVDPRISGLEADRKAFADEAKVLAATLREAERAHKKAARLSAEKHGRLVQGLRQELALALKAAEEQHQKDTQKLENELQTAREENSAAFQKASDSWADDKRAIIADFDTKMQALEENVEDERKVLNLKLANTKLTSDAALSKNASEMAALQELLRQEKVHLLHQTEQTTFSEAARYALEKELEFVKENLAREEETNTESTETLSALQVAHEALARDLILEKETRAGLESSLAEREQKADELSTEIHTVQEKLNVTLQQLEEVTAKLAAMTEASKEMDGQFAEQTIAIHEKQSSIAVLEARFQEAREMTEQMRNERDSARLEIAGATSRAAEVVEIMRDEIRRSRATTETAQAEVAQLRSDLVSAEKGNREEIAELKAHLEQVRTAAEKRAREAERAEGRYEGEREAWQRDQSAWDRERDRFVEEIQELKLEVARAKVAAAATSEDTEMKTWLTKLEADNRKLREEVAEVKALRRERRESDFEAARIRNQLNRLEEQNASLAAETAQKHAEWEQERGRLQREAERHQAAQDENEAPKRAEALVATRQAKRGNRKQPASPEEVENTAVTSTVNGIEPVLQKTHVAPKATRKPRKANAKLPDAENSTGTAAQQPTNNDTESPSQQPKSASAAEPHELPETRTNGRPRRAAQRTEWWKINGTGLPAAASTEEDAMDDESENEPHGGKQRTTTSRKAKHVREPPEEPMPAENRENVLPERGAEKEVPGQAPRKRKRKAIEDEDVAQEPDERDVPAPNKLTKPTAKSKKSEDQATASEQDFSNNVGQESTETQVEVSEATSSKQGTKTTKGARKATAKEIPIAVQPTGPISVEDILGLGTTSCKEDPKSKSKTARAKKPTKNGTSVVAESAESEGPVLPTLPNGNETSEPAAEGDEVTGKPTKKRKLNLAKKAKDEEDTENENPAKAKMQKSVSNKEAAVTVPESTVPAPVAAAAEPSSQTAASSSTSLSTSMTGAPTSSTAALGFGSRSLPNINNSGRMEFRKRPGLDPDRMKAILSGYGLQWSDRSEMR